MSFFATSTTTASLLSKSNRIQENVPLKHCSSSVRRMTTFRGVGTTPMAMSGKPFEVPEKFTKVQPTGGRVLIKIAETETQTKGGVLLTEGSQQKPTSGACFFYPFRRRRRLFFFGNWARWWRRFSPFSSFSFSFLFFSFFFFFLFFSSPYL